MPNQDIKMDYTQAMILFKDVSSKTQNVNITLSNLRNHINDMTNSVSGCWTGNLANKFIELFNSEMDALRNDFDFLICEIPFRIHQYAASYANADGNAVTTTSITKGMYRFEPVDKTNSVQLKVDSTKMEEMMNKISEDVKILCNQVEEVIQNTSGIRAHWNSEAGEAFYQTIIKTGKDVSNKVNNLRTHLNAKMKLASGEMIKCENGNHALIAKISI